MSTIILHSQKQMKNLLYGDIVEMCDLHQIMIIKTQESVIKGSTSQLRCNYGSHRGYHTCHVSSNSLYSRQAMYTQSEIIQEEQSLVGTVWLNGS